MKRIATLILFFLLSLPALKAQTPGRTYNVNSNGVQMGFSSERSMINATELASNVIYIINNTNKPLDFTLQLNPPAGWKLYGKSEIEIKLEPKDTQYYPVRVRPAYDIKGNTSYMVNAFLSTENFVLSNALWYVVVNQISAWQAYTQDNKFYLTELKDSVHFNLIISNQGNSDEALRIAVQPEKGILMTDEKGEVVLNQPISVYLKAGKDTILPYYLRLAPLSMRPTANGRSIEQQKRYRVKLQVLNEKTGLSNNRSWNGSIDVIKVESSTFIRKTRFEGLPMVVEFDTYDILRENTYSTLNLYGSKIFENQSMLNYYFQADFVKNEINPSSYMGNYQYIGYFHKRFSLELGDIGANRSGSTLSGKGAKASVNLYNNTVGALYIRRPKLFENYYMSGYGFFHELRLPKIRWENYYQHIDNNQAKVNSDLAVTALNFRINRTQSIKIGGGYSNELHFYNPLDQKQVPGFGAEFGYSGAFGKWGVQLNGNYGSASYTPRKGTLLSSASVRYRQNNKNAYEVAYSHFQFKPVIYTQGVVSGNNIFNFQDYFSAKWSINKGVSGFAIQPSYISIHSTLLDVNTGGTQFEYRYQSKKGFKFFNSLFLGVSEFPVYPDLKQIFILNLRSSFRYKDFQTILRYNYGPYYQVEQLQYIETKENLQKIYINTFYDYWFLNDKMRLNLNLNYNFSTVNTRQQLNLRSELFYYAVSGFRFSIYGRYILFGEGEYVRTYPVPGGGTMEEMVPASTASRFEMGAGVKFNVNVPTSFRQNYDVTVIAFRDMNGNGIMELNERGIGEMLIRLKLNDSLTQQKTGDEVRSLLEADEYELVTNDKGVVEYNNVPMGEYIITAMPLASMGGWFDGKTFYRTIDKNRTIYVPLSRGARLSGGILLERDRYGNSKELNLGNIRVTAVNQDNGQTYSTLTTSEGNFVMFVPNGNFVISINESAVGNRYVFTQNNIPVVINQDFENYNVSFFLSEKQRNINVSGKRSRPLPINRLAGNQKPAAPSDSLNPQFTQIEDTLFLPVIQPEEKGKVWVVQLYEDETSRKLVSEFDTLKGIIDVRCIPSNGPGFLYISESYPSKKKAKKDMDKVKDAGFNQAKVVEMVFGNPVAAVSAEPPKAIQKQIINIETDQEKALFRVEIIASDKGKTNDDLNKLVPDAEEVYLIVQDGIYKYSLGNFTTFEDAVKLKNEIQSKYNLDKIFVTQYKEAW